MSFSYRGKISVWDWYEAPEVTSTNDELKKFSSDKFPVVLSAERQTTGRGRRGRQWQNGEGNLYFTFSQNIEHKELSRFVCLIGLALAETVKKLKPDADVKIKWPNDVFVSHKKISGILLENIKDDIWAVGIGVNIAVAPEVEGVSYAAGSLKENKIIIDRTEFLRCYLLAFSHIQKEYAQNGFLPLRNKWLTYALNLGHEIIIKNDGSEQKGLFLTLDDEGYLLLKTNNGTERILAGDLFV